MDCKTLAAKTLKGACKLFLTDLQALPEEAFCKSFGPATRTIADIVYEVNLVNDHVCMTMRGEEPFEWPEGAWIKAPADLNTKAAVLSAFENSSAGILATVEAFSEEDMESKVQTEHGERTKFERCQFMALHIWYHCGQLNYVQTLLGDDAWHWK